MMGSEGPQGSGTRLNLEPGISVVLEFRAQSQVEALGKQPNLILNEPAPDLVLPAGWDECGKKLGLGLIRCVTEAQTPDQIVVVTPGQLLGEIEIQRVAVLALDELGAVGAVVVELQG